MLGLGDLFDGRSHCIICALDSRVYHDRLAPSRPCISSFKSEALVHLSVGELVDIGFVLCHDVSAFGDSACVVLRNTTHH